jgi:hypothetical protein
MQNDLEAFNVRLPSQLHAEIKITAKAEKRSMNNEIVVRLERSFAASQTCAADTAIKRLLLDRVVFLENQIELMRAELKTYK